MRLPFCMGVAAVLGLVCAGGPLARADQVQLQNGDRYYGKVVSLNQEVLVIQSDVLGTLRVPRAKVASVTLGDNPPASLAGAVSTNAAASAPAANPTNRAPEASALLRQLGTDTNLVRRVREQFLGAAGPEANAKFDELLNGLMSGTLTMNDLTTQARSAANQLRAAKKDLGEDAGWMLDSYLAILDRFLKDAPPPPATTNLSKPRAKPTPLLEED